MRVPEEYSHWSILARPPSSPYPCQLCYVIPQRVAANWDLTAFDAENGRPPFSLRMKCLRCLLYRSAWLWHPLRSTHSCLPHKRQSFAPLTGRERAKKERVDLQCLTRIWISEYGRYSHHVKTAVLDILHKLVVLRIAIVKRHQRQFHLKPQY